MRIFCPTKEILLFYDDSSVAFRHVKLYQQVAAVHAHSVGKKTAHDDQLSSKHQL